MKHRAAGPPFIVMWNNLVYNAIKERGEIYEYRCGATHCR